MNQRYLLYQFDSHWFDYTTKTPRTTRRVFVLTAGGNARYIHDEIATVPKARMQSTYRLA